LLDKEFEYDIKKDVHPATKKKYFKEILGLGQEDYEEGLKSGKYLKLSDIEIFAKIFKYHFTKLK